MINLSDKFMLSWQGDFVAVAGMLIENDYFCKHAGGKAKDHYLGRPAGNCYGWKCTLICGLP